MRRTGLSIPNEPITVFRWSGQRPALPGVRGRLDDAIMMKSIGFSKTTRRVNTPLTPPNEKSLGKAQFIISMFTQSYVLKVWKDIQVPRIYWKDYQ